MTPKKLSAERLEEIRERLSTHNYYGRDVHDLLAHCNALDKENQALRKALEFYANPEEPHVPIKWLTNRARTALENSK